MKDSLFIALMTVCAIALMVGSYWLGRSKQRHIDIWHPSPPPENDLKPLVDSFLGKVVDEQRRKIDEELVKRTQHHPGVAMPYIVRGDPNDRSTWTADNGFLVIPREIDPSEVRFIEMPVEESVRLVPRYPAWATPLAQEFKVDRPGNPTTFVNIKLPEGQTLADVVAKMRKLGYIKPLNAWPPPGKLPGGGHNYQLFPEEQEFWNEKLGDPTKKESK